jgi:microcystin-dependent protein
MILMDAFLGEIRMYAGHLAPADWAWCDGQLLSTAEHATLYDLIGTTYGGDGITSFALPDLRGRAPMYEGMSSVGNMQGLEATTLTSAQIPAHSHSVRVCSATGTQGNPAGAFWAAGVQQFSNGAPVDGQALSGAAISPAGQSLPHENMMPFLTVGFIICMNGYFPIHG